MAALHFRHPIFGQRQTAILTNIFWSCLYLFKYRTTLCTGLATLDSGHTCTKWFDWLTIKNPLWHLTIGSNSCFCFSEKFKVVVDDLPFALEDVHPSPFCEPCERNGKLKMTAGTYCVNCERKLCAAHQKVCVSIDIFSLSVEPGWSIDSIC